MSNIETIEVLYNDCYGEWKPSDKAIELYNKLKRESDPSFTEEDHYCWIERHDPILLQVYHDLGDEFDDKNFSNTKVEVIPKKDRNYYEITQYDGREVVTISPLIYELELLKKDIMNIIMNKEKLDQDKLMEIKDIINNHESKYDE